MPLLEAESEVCKEEHKAAFVCSTVFTGVANREKSYYPSIDF